MARVKIPLTVLGPDGRPFSGAAVTIRKRSDNSTATVYAADTGAGTIANPQNTGIDGRIAGWVERGAYNAVVAATPPLAGYTEAFDAAAAGDQTIDTAWIADAAVLAAILPVGIVLPYPGSAEPSDYWKFLNGQTLTRASFPDLNAMAAAAGYANGWGPGNGTTTFTLPDWRDRVPAGIGGPLLGLTLGQKTGAATVTLDATQIPAHTHPISDPGHQHGFGNGSSNFWPPINQPGSAVTGIGAGTPNAGLTGTASAQTGITATNANTGGGSAHPNVQPTVGVNWMLRAK